MKICVVGIGYVGLANALMLCKNNNVIMLDIDPDKVKQVNQKQSPIKDTMIEEYLSNTQNSINATLNKQDAYENCDYIIIATPTDYNEDAQCFNTKTIESVMLDIVKYNKNAVVIIKSTIPIGYIKYLKSTFAVKDVIFCPEFLREGSALYDNLYPSRIIIGSYSENAQNIAKLFSDSVLKKDVPVLFMSSEEAESVKLFSNTYLAMRIGFFNELDIFAKNYNLEAKNIIAGVCADPRIGNYYNNPSFGYGGYCLPKDSKQLLANFKDIPNALIQAAVKTNEIRKNFIVKQILSLSKNINNIGFYRLIMKHNADNFRNSIMLELIDEIQKYRNVVIYEPLINTNKFSNCNIENDFNKFINGTEIVVANRLDDQIAPYKNKVYTSDIYTSDI
ncbi:nucleotide sugar dehydrogenase [Campylobacter volucris]|uniref:UDP-glucose 6-dehydrogenase n=1 Tax=Campylobacter volucris TaxID=1031542 RepID=A0AAE6D046_9BACT|nr:nucleotide sugar dehydrogenase [Campylobacter volucris]AJC93638.1 UDP-glucose 6-dehydrogenase [Campylobacter volucris LMG 24379]KAB0579879.1 nucleotide sugar dehydrogenase [Campylobacter volucris]QBL13976.1 nucleotide sugar dehydrogenase [Campylobacter volucris]QEL07851.1 UDP-glucose 6-dehydrogenase [Campylobacter volucris]TXK70803.1 nucleotide sugar dehydrogenase [Campylobacter volucris]